MEELDENEEIFIPAGSLAVELSENAEDVSDSHDYSCATTADGAEILLDDSVPAELSSSILLKRALEHNYSKKNKGVTQQYIEDFMYSDAYILPNSNSKEKEKAEVSELQNQPDESTKSSVYVKVENASKSPADVPKPRKPDTTKKKLKDYPRIMKSIRKSPEELLLDIHFLLFNEGDRIYKLKRNILEFKEFPFEVDSEEYNGRRDFLERMSDKTVDDVAKAFRLDVKSNRDETISHILSFLRKPDESYINTEANAGDSSELSDIDELDIEEMFESDDSITCEVVSKKVECVDLLSSGEESEKKVVAVKTESVEKNPIIVSVVSAPLIITTSTSSQPVKSVYGTLKNLERICKIVNTHPDEYLADIYELLYLKKYNPRTLREEILAFTGFDFHVGSTEYAKRKLLLDRMEYDNVWRIYNTLIPISTEVKMISKFAMITDIFNFLLKLPDVDTSVINIQKRMNIPCSLLTSRNSNSSISSSSTFLKNRNWSVRAPLDRAKRLELSLHDAGPNTSGAVTPRKHAAVPTEPKQKVPLTSSERCRLYRHRKKLEHASVTGMSEVPETLVAANVSQMNIADYIDAGPNTSAAVTPRKHAAVPREPKQKVPMTNAERCRYYRQRKKLNSACATGMSKVPGTLFAANVSQVDITDYIDAGPITTGSVAPRKRVEVPTKPKRKVPLTSAERCRFYRQRKKLKSACATGMGEVPGTLVAANVSQVDIADYIDAGPITTGAVAPRKRVEVPTEPKQKVPLTSTLRWMLCRQRKKLEHAFATGTSKAPGTFVTANVSQMDIADSIVAGFNTSGAVAPRKCAAVLTEPKQKVPMTSAERGRLYRQRKEAWIERFQPACATGTVVAENVSQMDISDYIDARANISGAIAPRKRARVPRKPKQKVPMTSAERGRLFRQRKQAWKERFTKKRLEPACATGTINAPLTLVAANVSQIDIGDYIDAGPNTSGAVAPRKRARVPRKPKQKVPMTSAERGRLFRQRKQAWKERFTKKRLDPACATGTINAPLTLVAANVSQMHIGNYIDAKPNTSDFQRVSCFPREYLVGGNKLLFMTNCDSKIPANDPSVKQIVVMPSIKPLCHNPSPDSLEIDKAAQEIKSEPEVSSETNQKTDASRLASNVKIESTAPETYQRILKVEPSLGQPQFPDSPDEIKPYQEIHGPRLNIYATNVLGTQDLTRANDGVFSSQLVHCYPQTTTLPVIYSLPVHTQVHNQNYTGYPSEPTSSTSSYPGDMLMPVECILTEVPVESTTKESKLSPSVTKKSVAVPIKSKSSDSSKSSLHDKIRDSMNDTDEDECDKPLASFLGHPNDRILEQQICDIVEKTDLQDITINIVIQKIFDMYPKFDLNYRKEYIKSTLRSVLYRLGEQKNNDIQKDSANLDSPDCSVSTTFTCQD